MKCSKGKREKKRRRKASHTLKAPDKQPPSNGDLPVSTLKPPEIQKYVTIGFNSTTRHLEMLARVSDPCHLGAGHSAPTVPKPLPAALDPPRPMAAILVPRLDQPPIMHAHLPLLVSLASRESPSPRLVTLPKGAEEQLKCAVGIPHIGLVGLLEGAPNRSAIELIRQSVPDVEVHWLREARVGRYKPVNIKAVSITVPYGKKNVPSRSPRD